jgi:hypothetical protein
MTGTFEEKEPSFVSFAHSFHVPVTAIRINNGRDGSQPYAAFTLWQKSRQYSDSLKKFVKQNALA